jgi:putative ABC transport system permease protein
VLLLLTAEGVIVTGAGVLLGAAASAGLVAAGAPWLQQAFGITLRWSAPTASMAWLVVAVLAAGMLASLLPAVRAYRLSLADGLSPRS